MSVTEQRPAFTSHPRRSIPSAVKLAPELVNDFCTDPAIDEAGPDKPRGAAGLLFGTAEGNLVTIAAFKAFPISASAEDDLPKPEFLDLAFEGLMADAKTDPELASLHLIGWYGIHGSGDNTRLFDRDIEFHNRLFRRASDLALIFNPKNQKVISADLYSRSSLNVAMSTGHHRSGSLLLNSTARLSAPVNVTLRERVEDDQYLRVFEVLDSLDRAEKRERWKKVAFRLKTVSTLRPGRMRTRPMPHIHTHISDTAGLPVQATTRLSDDSMTPHVSSPLNGSQPARTKVGWTLLTALALVLIAIGVGVAGLYWHQIMSALPSSILSPEPSSKHNTIRTHAETSPFQQFGRTAHAEAVPLAAPQSDQAGTRIGNNENGLVTPENARVTRPASLYSAATPAASHPRETASAVIRPAPTNVLAPERKAQPNRNSAIIDSAEVSPGERHVERTDSNSGNAEVRKPVKELGSKEPSLSSTQPAASAEPSSKYVPARPVKQVVPNASVVRSSAPSEATDVEVEVRIDEGGRVTEAHVVNDSSNTDAPLTTAALTAAREWTFEPAKMDGKSVAGNHMIRFHFTPKGRQP